MISRRLSSHYFSRSQVAQVCKVYAYVYVYVHRTSRLWAELARIKKNVGSGVNAKWSLMWYRKVSKMSIFRASIDIFQPHPNIDDIEYLVSILAHPQK